MGVDTGTEGQMGIIAHTDIPAEIKINAYDALCKAYEDGSRMDFSLFGRGKHGFNSTAEYIGYAWMKMAFQNGTIEESGQLEL